MTPPPVRGYALPLLALLVCACQALAADLVIDNRTMTGTETIPSSGVVNTLELGGAGGTSCVVAPGAQVTAQARTMVSLKVGTWIQAGAAFHARLTTEALTVPVVVEGAHLVPSASLIAINRTYPIAVTGSYAIHGTDRSSTLTYAWSMVSGPGAPVFGATGTNAAQSTTVSCPVAGVYTLRCTLTSDMGTTATTDLVVTACAPPIITAGPTATPATVTSGSTDLAVSATDPQGLALSYQWSGDPSVSFDAATAAATTARFAASGNFPLQVVVTNAAGATASGTVTVTVSAGPVITDVATTWTDSRTLALAVTASDPGAGTLTYAYTAQGPAAVSFAPAGAAQTSATFAAAGPYIITVTVTNPAGLSASRDCPVQRDQVATTVAVVPAPATPPAWVVASPWSIPFRALFDADAAVADQFGAVVNGASVTWSATGGSTISQLGVLDATVQGATGLIIAQSGSVQGQASYRVGRAIDQAVSLQVLPASGAIVAPHTLCTATCTLSDGSVHPVADATWSIAGASGITIAANGEITSNYSIGQVTVTAIAGTLSASSTLQVVPPAPVVEPPGGDYTAPQQVTITAPFDWYYYSAFRYTLDGSEPTAASPVFDAATLSIAASTVLRVRIDQDGVLGMVASHEYVLRAVAPRVMPASGTYTEFLTAVVRAELGTVARYTLDGTEPTAASSEVPEGGILVDRSLTLRARAFHPTRLPSATVSATYVLGTQAPRLTPSGGPAASPLTVQAISSTPGAVLRYTLDGSDPLAEGSPWPVDGLAMPLGAQQLRVVAQAPGCEPSPVIVADYLIQEAVAAPVLTPASGTHAVPMTVQAACATGGAVLRYTIDGREPGDADPLWPTDGLVIDTPSSLLLRVSAMVPGMHPGLASGSYICTAALDDGTPKASWSSAALPVVASEGEVHCDIVLDRPASAAGSIALVASGDAEAGVDVADIPASIAIAVGDVRIPLVLQLPSGAAAAGTRHLILALAQPGDADAYRLGSPTQIDIRIAPAGPVPTLGAPSLLPSDGSFVAPLAATANASPADAVVWFTIAAGGAEPPAPVAGAEGCTRWNGSLDLLPGLWRLRAVSAWPDGQGGWTQGPERAVAWRLIGDRDPRQTTTQQSQVSPASIVASLPGGVAVRASLVAKMDGQVFATAPAMVTSEGRVIGNIAVQPPTKDGKPTEVLVRGVDANGRALEARVQVAWMVTDLLQPGDEVIRAGDMLQLGVGGAGYSRADGAAPFLLRTGVGNAVYTVAGGGTVMAAYPEPGIYTATLSEVDGTLVHSKRIVVLTASFTDPSGPLLAHTEEPRPVAVHLGAEAADRLVVEVLGGSAENLPAGAGDLSVPVTIPAFESTGLYGPWKCSSPVVLLKTQAGLVVAARAITPFQFVAEPMAVQAASTASAEHWFQTPDDGWAHQESYGEPIWGNAVYRIDIVPAIAANLFTQIAEISSSNQEVAIQGTVASDKGGKASDTEPVFADSSAFVQSHSANNQRMGNLTPRQMLVRFAGRDGAIEVRKSFPSIGVAGLELRGSSTAPLQWPSMPHWDGTWFSANGHYYLDPGSQEEWSWGQVDSPPIAIPTISVTPIGLDEERLKARTSWSAPYENAWKQQSAVASECRLTYRPTSGHAGIGATYSASHGISPRADEWTGTTHIDVVEKETYVQITGHGTADRFIAYNPYYYHDTYSYHFPYYEAVLDIGSYYELEDLYYFSGENGYYYSMATDVYSTPPASYGVGNGYSVGLTGDAGQNVIFSSDAGSRTARANEPGEYDAWYISGRHLYTTYATLDSAYTSEMFAFNVDYYGNWGWHGWHSWEEWYYNQSDWYSSYYVDGDMGHFRLVVPGTRAVANGLKVESRRYENAAAETKSFTVTQSNNRVAATKSESGVTSAISWSADGTADISTSSSATINYAFARDDEVTATITGDARGIPIRSTVRKISDGLGAPSGSAPLIGLPGGFAVSAASGNVLFSIPVVPVVNDLPGLTLTYNSQEGFDHGYGCGWRTNWDMRVVSATGSGAPTTLIDETGARVPIGGPHRGATYTLTAARETGGTTLTRGDGVWLDFDANGWLVRVRFPNERTWTIERTAHVAPDPAPEPPPAPAPEPDPAANPGFRPVTSVSDSRTGTKLLTLTPLAADIQRRTGMGSLVINSDRTWKAKVAATTDTGVFAAWNFTYHGADKGYALATVHGTGASADAAGVTLPVLNAAVDYSLIPVDTADTTVPPTQTGIRGYARCTSVTYGGGSQHSIAYEKVTIPNPNVDGIWPATVHTRTTLTDPQGAVTAWRLQVPYAWDSIRNAVGVEVRQQIEEPSGYVFPPSYQVALRNKVLRRWTQVGGVRQDETTTRYDSAGRPDRIVRAPGTANAVTTDVAWNIQARIPTGQHVANRRTTYAVLGVDGSGPVDLSSYTEVGSTGPDAALATLHVDASNQATRVAYTGQGLLDAVIDACRTTWKYVTSAAGLPTVPTSPAGRGTQVTPVAGVPGLAGTVVGNDGVEVGSAYDPYNASTMQKEQGLADATTVTSPLGLVLRTTSRTGEVRTWTYDALLRPKRLHVVPPTTADSALQAGHAQPTPTIPDETWDYDQEGSGLKVTHQRGADTLSITITDAAGRVVSRTDKRSGGYGQARINVVSTTVYQANSDRIASISAAGVVRVPTYDSLGRITGWSETAGGVTRSTSTVLNALGWRLSATDANGLTSHWTYDRQGNVVRTINPAGGWQWIGRDEAGRETARRSSQGAAESTMRDADGVAVGQRDRFGNEVTYTETGKDGITERTTTRTVGSTVVSARDRRDATTRNTTATAKLGELQLESRITTWNADGLPRTSTAVGEAEQKTAWAAGIPWQSCSTVTLPGGSSLALISTQSLTADGRPGTATDGFGNTATATPDGVTGDVDESVAVVAGATRTTRVLQRDSVGRPLRVQTTLALAGASEVSEVSTTYDAFGQVATRTGADGVTESYTYDLGGRTLTRTRPGQGTTTFAYDVLGNAVTVTDGAGRSLLRVHDAIGRLVNEQRGTDVTAYDYHADTLRLRRKIEPGLRITTYEYDAQGLLAKITRPGGQEIEQKWDAAGRLTKRVYPDQTSESWTYGPRNMRTEPPNSPPQPLPYQDTHTDRLSHVWTYSYNGNGQLLTLSRSGGTTLTWTVTAIDENGAKLQRTITEAGASGTRIETIRLDADGRIISRTLPGSAAITYAYDAAGRLLRRGDLTYTYDAVGRLQTAGHDGTPQVSLEYDADTGQLYRQHLPHGVTRELGYDASGLTNRVSLSGDVSATWTADRDSAGRLLRVVEPEGAVTYSYQAGRVIQAERTGTSAYRIAWTTDARGNRTVRDVYLGMQPTALAFATAGELPAAITVESGSWTVADGRLSTTGTGSARVELGSGALPRLSWWWSGAATVLLRDAAGTWVEVRRDDDGAGLARVVVRNAAGVALAATTWQTATALAAVEAAIDASGGLMLRSGSAEVSAMTTLTGLANATLESGAAGAAFDDLRWESGGQRVRTATTPDLMDRPITTTETTTDAAGTELAKRTTTQAYDLAGRLLTRTVKDGNDVTLSSDAATWDDLDRMATWASASGSTAFTYRPGSKVPMSDRITWGSNSPVERSYTADDGGIMAVDGTRYGVIGRTALWEDGPDGVVALPGDLSGSVAGRIGRLAGGNQSDPAIWLQRTIYHPDGRSLVSTAYRDAELGITYTGFTPGLAGGVGYRSMYRHPQVGQYRTDHRWLDVDGAAFTSADPAWPGTGDSQYAYCGGDPVNRADPSGLDWEYVNGHWSYVDGTNPHVPRPNDSLTPARLGLSGNVFTRADYRRVAGTAPGMIGFGEFSHERVYGPLRKLAFTALYKRFGGPGLSGRDKTNAAAAAMLLADLLDKNFDYENGDQRFFDSSFYDRNDVMTVLKQNYIRDTVFNGLQDASPLAAYGFANVAAGSVRNILTSQFARAEAAAMATAGMRATAGIAEAEALAGQRLASGGVPAGSGIPTAWNGLPLARNLFQGINELEIRLAGASVGNRALLNPNLPQGRYMWVVDRKGQFWVGSAQKHSGLVPAGEQVRGAGWLEVLPGGKVRVNAGSGHYMDGYFNQLTPSEIAKWRNAVAETARRQGVTVETITDADQFVDMVAPVLTP